MAKPAIPHFAYPFHFHNHGDGVTAHMVEQDSLDDVASCVTTILLTEIGFRDLAPDFGIPDLTFREIPIGTEDLTQQIIEQEDRAEIVIEEDPDLYDQLLDNFLVRVSTVGGE